MVPALLPLVFGGIAVLAVALLGGLVLHVRARMLGLRRDAVALAGSITAVADEAGRTAARAEASIAALRGGGESSDQEERHD